MENQWASEHLHLIRTLMERSALYRRALAPIMMVSGSIGLIASLASQWLELGTNRAFAAYWLCVSLVTFCTALLLVRRQALKDREPFWSPPTRRVGQALLPGFLAGFLVGALHGVHHQPITTWLLALAWIILYGCALHGAGFFMPRGIKLLGWAFVLGGCLLLVLFILQPHFQTSEVAHMVMGAFFGGLHLGCGAYLYFTENRRKST